MEKGTIIKALSGFYYVEREDGSIVTTRGRGLLKNKKQNILVGDEVEFQLNGKNEGVINKILERKNSFIRPPVANVDKVVIVASATVPKANPILIDKFIVMAIKNNSLPILCINKVDKGDEVGFLHLKNIYEPVCRVIGVSASLNKGMDELKEVLANSKVALAGPSGVGKSTIISNLSKRKDLEVGPLSDKTRRGKHTTRHVEIFSLENNGKLFDTPGFSSFDIFGIDKYSLAKYYLEIEKLGDQCKYKDCLHINEPECAVKEALEQDKISRERYESYVYNLGEIESKNKY